MNARKVCLRLVVALVLTAGVALAQPEVEWTRVIDAGASDFCTGVVQLADSGFALCGYTGRQGNPDWNFLLIRTDSQGNVVWTRTYGGAGQEKCYSILQTEDNGFLLAGSAYYADEDRGCSYLVKTDENGDERWSRLIGGQDYEYCEKIVFGGGGEIGVIGFALELRSGTYLANFTELSENGDSLWSQRYRLDVLTTLTSGVGLDNGDYVLLGNSASDISAPSNIQILQIDGDNGDTLWARTLGTSGRDLGTDFLKLRDGGYVFAGQWGIWGDITDYDFGIGKVSEEGDSLWAKNYLLNGSDHATAIIETEDGGIAIGGACHPIGDGNGNDNYLLIRTNQNGDSLWSLTYARPGIDGFEDKCSSVLQTYDGGFLMAGNSGDLGMTHADFLLLKTTPDPASVREPPVLAPFALQLAQPYPNPFNATVTIPFSFGPINRGATGVVRMAIFDPLGRRVADFSPRLPQLISANRHSLTWNASGMPAGQYIVILQAGNQQLSQRLSLVK